MKYGRIDFTHMRNAIIPLKLVCIGLAIKNKLMKTINDISNQNIPLVAIDKSLDKLRDKIMFPKKLEKANRVLSSAKLPNKRPHS